MGASLGCPGRARTQSSDGVDSNTAFKKDNYHDSEYGNQLLLGLYEKYKSGELTDITLTVGDQSIRAHKVVLCGFSKYFDAMLTGPELESSEDEIAAVPHGVSPNAAQLLLEFAYTGRVTITRNNVKELLRAASAWSLVAVQLRCTKLLEDYVRSTKLECHTWCSDEYAASPQMMTGDGTDITYYDESKAKKVTISGMKMWIRNWDGHRVVGGLQVFFSNGQVQGPNGNTKDPLDVFEFHLDKHEVITRVELQSGWCIDTMAFFTNKARKFGPYGGVGGGIRWVDPPGVVQALTWISFTTEEAQDALLITCLKFGFRYYELD